MRKKYRTPTMKTFIVFSTILFLVILIAGSVVFVFSMRQIIRTNKTNELTQVLETEKIRLESTLNPEIAIVLKMANSPVVKKYIINPDDPVMKKNAEEEIASYRQAFTGFSIFWINNKDKLFYSDDNTPYFVDPADPVNYWYNLTLYETETYNFNINYNPDINQIRLWVNAPVFDDNHKPVGMVGTGIELSEFVNTFYRHINGQTELYYFIEGGKIYASKDVGLITSGANIKHVMNNIGFDVLAEAETIKTEETRTFDTSNGVTAVGYIPSLNWYYAASVSFGLDDYVTAITALFLVVLVVILMIIIIFNLFVAGFLKSLRKASESLALATKKREQELVADNDMLDRLNRMKTEFFQNMSHDFKTPLTVISTSVLNAADMLDFEMEKDKMRDILGNAQNEIMRMSRMVESAMKYSALHDNRQDMKPLDLASLLREGAETHRALLERNDNTLVLDIPQSLPLIYGNADMLLLVLSNILSNANRHTRGGRITISADVKVDVITVTVRDSGAGVKPELLPHIFERGVSEGSTGLGLSICKTAIEAHHGTISVESVYGQGAAVIFILPAYKSE